MKDALLSILFVLSCMLPYCLPYAYKGWELTDSSLHKSPLEASSDRPLATSSVFPHHAYQYHGTTTLSFVCAEGIVVAVDSRASMGDYVGSRTVRKIFPISSRMVATMAGGAADCSYW